MPKPAAKPDAPDAPDVPINEGPFDRMVHIGGGRYVEVRIGEPMPVPASATADAPADTDTPEEG